MTEKRYFVYGRSSCDFCIMAVDYLLASNRDVTFLDHETDRDFIEEIKSFYSFETVPVILENDTLSGKVRKIGGYTNLIEWFVDDK